LGCSSPDIPAIKNEILHTDDRDAILVAAAVGQVEVLPELRARMKPVDFATAEGAAQAAAARLGDEDAIRQLFARLTQEGDRSAAFVLGFVGTERTLRIGFDYLLMHQHEPRVFKWRSDVPEVGPGFTFVSGASSQLDDVPSPNDELGKWIDWWNTNKPSFKVVTPSSTLSDPILQCYGRIAEWGLGVGVRNLYSSGGEGTLDAIRKYARRIDQLAALPSFATSAGSAKAVLAKAGDRGSFNLIVNSFKHGNLSDRLNMLRFIANAGSFEVLVKALDSSFFEGRQSTFSTEQELELRVSIFKALSAAVRNPPLSADAAPTGKNAEIWEIWWEQNRDRIDDLLLPFLDSEAERIK